MSDFLVLIVSNPLDDYQTLKEFLIGKGYDVETVASVTAMLAARDSRPPDVVIIAPESVGVTREEMRKYFNPPARTKLISIVFVIDGKDEKKYGFGGDLDYDLDQYTTPPYDPEEILLRVQYGITASQRRAK